MVGYFLFFFAFFAPLREVLSDPRAEADDIPVVGRPSDLPFSEASGWFAVQARAEPTTVEAETPLTFTLRVRAVRPTRKPPQRIDLRQLTAFDEAFFIEDSGEEAARPDDRTWEFVYRLKPRHTEVREIPSLPFVYFNPYLLTASKGFQVLYTDPIPLHVLSHESVEVPVQAPERAFVLATEPAVLEHPTLWTPPSLATCLLLLVAPPTLCALWYIGWRRLNPDAARLASQRRSRSARQALDQLHATRRLDAEQRAMRTAAIVTDYLHERLEMSIAEPTPREVEQFFVQHACSPALTELAVQFFQACDSARFLPASSVAPIDLHDAAVRLILAVEEETCSSLSS